MKTALTVAGSDSGGGAGIQADLKSFAALGVHGTSVITALTAQNTLGVTAIYDIPPSFIEAQFDAVASDIGVDAMKTGMLFSAEIIDSVCRKIKEFDITNVVVDPVMVATSGDLLLKTEAVDAIKESLIPLAAVITPNRREAEVLSGIEIRDEGGVKDAARRIHELGSRYVLVKGGHADGDAVDWLFDGKEFASFRAQRVVTTNTHGTGCTLSAAIAALLALGKTVPEAVDGAKRYITAAIQHAYPLGKGHGPVNHLFALYRG
ncbi:MAG: bifunctional hydroxymethylpyrimidine kinase/phosphomethylpyrimidine kinase [Chloroflexota bacterium]|jgi:hydroxymethylpyrimidine/phosphomethylpyrimidine kinase